MANSQNAICFSNNFYELGQHLQKRMNRKTSKDGHTWVILVHTEAQLNNWQFYKWHISIEFGNLLIDAYQAN